MLAPTLFARCQIVVLYGEICGLPVEILEHCHGSHLQGVQNNNNVYTRVFVVVTNCA